VPSTKSNPTPQKKQSKTAPAAPATSKPASIFLKTPSASYEIAIGSGLLATLYPRLQKLMGKKQFRPFLVTSPKIWELWSEQVRVSFPEAQSPTVLFLPAGEKHKRLAAVESLAEQLAEHGADRDALLIAFGGGVLGDITGFLAAIYMRGVPYVQLPTTLLAQVDSSVGGKTGVNLKAGKNLVGSFHHPRLVVADIDTLKTLPAEELRAGLHESIKAGIIRDPKLFAFLEQNRELILEGNPEALAKVVTASVKVKADVVSQDELESGLRMTLNFGHTIGHAIEAATGYKQLLHGEAVAWGSIAALFVGLHRNTITQPQFDRMVALIRAYGPLPAFKAKAKKLVELTSSDKKARSGRRAYVLPTGIGSTEVAFDVTDAELLEATKAMLAMMKEA
jgi:3-dehydroquinate synthase